MATLLASNNEISTRPIDAVSRVRLMLDAYMRFGLENPNTYLLAFCSNRVELSAMRHEVASDLGATDQPGAPASMSPPRAACALATPIARHALGGLSWAGFAAHQPRSRRGR